MCLSNAPTLPFVSLFLTGSFFCLENHDGAPAATATSPLSKRKVFGGWVLSFFLFLQKKKNLMRLWACDLTQERESADKQTKREKSFVWFWRLLFCLVWRLVVLLMASTKKKKKKEKTKYAHTFVFSFGTTCVDLFDLFFFFRGVCPYGRSLFFLLLLGYLKTNATLSKEKKKERK